MINNSVMKCCICINKNSGEFTIINNKKYHLCCIEDLQQRIDKAIEYVEENTVYFSELHKVGNYFVNCKSDELLEILKGSDKE